MFGSVFDLVPNEIKEVLIRVIIGVKCVACKKFFAGSIVVVIVSNGTIEIYVYHGGKLAGDLLYS